MDVKHQGLKKIGFFFIFCITLIQTVVAQNKIYNDSIFAYQQHYINTHEVVGKDDRRYINFYPVDKNYRVNASFKKTADVKDFEMTTSSGIKQKYFEYGLLTFKLHNALVHLYMYQSASLIQQENYKNYLFVPFTDATSGFESYGGGRYLDFTTADIKNNHLIIDFNKAYNPYCAYTSGYNCPVPPKQNFLNIPIKAGEKSYGKPVH